MNELTNALAAKKQPVTTYQALDRLVQETIGAKLFTLMEVDHERGVAWRSYSNMPEAYPTSGEKPMMDNAWSEQVHGRHETFVANSIEDIAAVFSDYELIQSLGCESCINVPVVIGGELVGTLNCLDVAGHYTPARVAAAQSLKQSGAIAFLLSATLKETS